ncbi:MAG: hypothetical protein ACOCVR_03500 [Myxococcota bacterium]
MEPRELVEGFSPNAAWARCRLEGGDTLVAPPARRVLRCCSAVLATLLASSALTACNFFADPLEWEGLEPMEEENLAPYPGSDDDPHPEELGVTRGEAEDYEWVHARGFVHAPTADVWEAVRDPDVLVDRRRVGEWSTIFDVDSRVPVSFVTSNVVYDVITLRFDTMWRQAHLEGSEERPVRVLARGDLSEPSMLLSVLKTSVTLEELDDDLTEIGLVRHIDAVAAGADDAEQYLRDLYESIVAVAHGRPLPRWDS